MINSEAARRHGEALRLFEAGLRAFHEATGQQPTPSRAEDVRKEGPPAGSFLTAAAPDRREAEAR